MAYVCNRVSVPAEHEDQLDPRVLHHLLAPCPPDGRPGQAVPGGGEHGQQEPDLSVGRGAGAGLWSPQGRLLLRPYKHRHIPGGSLVTNSKIELNKKYQIYSEFEYESNLEFQIYSVLEK